MIRLSKVSILLSFHFCTLAQINENKVGFNHIINSELLGNELLIQVYQPKSSIDTTKSYPVVYVLDGQRFFLSGVSLLHTFQQYDLTPEFIIVGISTNYPQRFSYFSDHKLQFAEFLQKEVLPLIDTNYPVTEERILFGWEYGGSMAFHLLATEHSFFNGYLLASPFPIQDKIKHLDTVQTLQRSVFFSVSPYEFEVNHGVDKLDSVLSSRSIEGLNWSYVKLEQEDHRSTPYPTLYHGLRYYFRYYPELQIDDYKTFISKGSLDYAYRYNELRANQYGFPPELSVWTKFTIIRSAMRDENIDAFISFSEELDLNSFAKELHPVRVNNLALFYEKNGYYQEAIKLFKILLAQYPNSEKLLTNIGNAYKSLENLAEAEKYFEKANAIAQKNE